ncbi:hypothetical protein FE257_011277 [Aspergillus nanangensis]|uniref:F-box domain-containing protein n=1 Tax=Aspergillus nanangensis TaxID=2582783 RepID=A0AAD4CJA7_ASPNN|nr:hypothetical protein FE257_011277 [Aspergillus nanangensis]
MEIVLHILSYLPFEALLAFGETSRTNYRSHVLCLKRLRLGVFEKRVHSMIACLQAGWATPDQLGTNVPNTPEISRDYIVSVIQPRVRPVNLDFLCKSPLGSPNARDSRRRLPAAQSTRARTQEQMIRIQNRIFARIVNRYGRSLVKLEFMAYDLDGDGARVLGTHCQQSLRHLALRFEHQHIRDGHMRPTQPEFLSWLGGLDREVEEPVKEEEEEEEEDVVPGQKLETLWLEHCHRLVTQRVEDYESLPDESCDAGLEWVRELKSLKSLSFDECLNLPSESAAQLWEQALNKLLPKRAMRKTAEREIFFSVDSHTTAQTFNTVNSEHTDGFYKYSQDLIDQETHRRQALDMDVSGSTEFSFESAMMTPSELPPLPYTVGAPKWELYSEAVKNLNRISEDDALEWMHSVLSVFSRVYAVAKMLLIVLMYYGIELEDTPDGVLAHLRSVEDIATSNSVIHLIEAIENLYYALYARLIMEMANVDLCSYYYLNLRSQSSKDGFVVPEPNHLLKIYLHFKGILEAPTVCQDLNVDLLSQYQAAYIYRVVDLVTNAGSFYDELLGYRGYVMKLLGDASTEFRRKWEPDVMYQMPPAELLAILSEKYLAFMPKAGIADPVPIAELPFVNQHTVDPEVWERRLILDHRQATLAKLEGRSVGDVRREEDYRRLSDYSKEGKCVCRLICCCANECTKDPERPCPCAARLLRIAVTKKRQGSGVRGFGVRCGTLAKAIFEGVAMIRRDVDSFEIAVELNRAMLLFAEELQKLRLEAARENGVSILTDVSGGI